MFCRPKFRGEVEMPVLLGNDDPAHSVTILDQVQVDQEEKMTKCQITCKSLRKKCQNFLRVWHWSFLGRTSKKTTMYKHIYDMKTNKNRNIEIYQLSNFQTSYHPLPSRRAKPSSGTARSVCHFLLMLALKCVFVVFLFFFSFSCFVFFV